MPSGEEVTRNLLFSYFNGVYRRNETIGLHDDRPVYTEQSKFEDGLAFDTTIGAQIKYCDSESAWVFSHPNSEYCFCVMSNFHAALSNITFDSSQVKKSSSEQVSFASVIVYFLCRCSNIAILQMFLLKTD